MQLKQQPSVKEFEIVQVLSYPFLAVLLMWMTYYVDVKFDLDLAHYGIFPRKPLSLFGIFTTPFLHGSLSHLINNSLPIFMLSAGVLYFYPRPALRIFFLSVLIPGLFTWLLARPSYHIGASGVVYALAFFVFFSGVLRRNSYLLALSLLVAFLYGSLFFGMFPMEEGISWESHLGGGISGILVALIFRKQKPTERVAIKEKPLPTPEEEASDPYIQQIGDAWKLPHQLEDASHTDDNIHPRDSNQPKTPIQIQYNFQPSNSTEKKSTDSEMNK